MSVLVWPVPRWLPKYSYTARPRGFGCPRDGGKRKHAGCDLYAPEGSDVLAIAPGRVREVYPFYRGTDAIEVDHGALGVIRYGEVDAVDGIKAGMMIHAGFKLATIARLEGMARIHPMLHLELYTGKGKGRLSQPGNAYHRRGDLVNPTHLLDRIRFEAVALYWNVA